MNSKKPTTYQGDLAKLPRALAPLIERPQWAVWRWTRKVDGSWQKPPFQAMQPDCNASTSDPSTWTDYEAALDAVETGRADGITYVLTKNDPFAAIDIDHCRDISTHSIDVWAQNFLNVGRNGYSEVTPSGTGLRIWGFADGASVNRKFTLEIDGKQVAAELFRRAPKALTITGLTLNPSIHELANIDRAIDWGVIWGERRKVEAAKSAPIAGNGFNGGNGSGYSVDEIEGFVRSGAPEGKNRSDLFHTIVGHYIGVGWDGDRILAHLGQFPDGIGGRYLSEGRLSGEIARSAAKYTGTLPQLDVDGWINGFETKAPAPAEPDPLDDPELDDDLDEDSPVQNPVSDPELDDDLDEEPDEDLEFDDGLDEEPDDELDENTPPTKDPNLPPLYAHGDPDDRPLKSWTIKHLLPRCGHGLLSGQWGAGKTFVVFDLAGAVITGQPWLGHMIKRQCGVLLIAAEGGDEVRLRLEAMVRLKCGNMARAPFRWYETMPTLLLHKDATAKLIAMAKQAEKSLQDEFGLPLGLIIVDTVAASAGYMKHGDENDNAVGQALMNVLKNLAQKMDCFVLGVDHFGKDVSSGTRGAYAKESSADLVLACLGEKELSGNVTETRLAVRKSRGGRQGQEHWFDLETVQAPEPDEDGDPIETKIVNWQSGPPGESGGAARPPRDPWAEPRRQDQKTAVLRLKRVLMGVLADQGVDLPVAPDGPTVRMVDQEIVREQFYAGTPAEGTQKQKRQFRHLQFKRALGWAEDQQLIGIGDIGEITYVWLARLNTEENEQEPG